VNLEYPPEAEAFRSDVQAWLTERLPAGWSEGVRPQGADWSAFCAEWDARLHAEGWAVPTWPEEYGGRGLSVLQAAVFAEEVARAGAPIQPPLGGEILVGPTILHWGDDAQKRRYLAPIARGEEIWAQAFSEPGAGSDLASLCTTARVEGDELVVDGHKIWTSQAPDADFFFLLARTDPDAAPHRGISYLLLPARQRGVEVRPIAQPDGTAGFAEVLLDGARCPLDGVLGGMHNGWQVAMSTLQFERGTSATSSWYRYDRDLAQIVRHAIMRGIDRDATIRQRIAASWTRVQIMRFQGLQVLTSALRPEVAGRTRALEACTKLFWTEFHQELTELAIDVMGADAMVLDGDGTPAVGVGLGHRPAVHPYPVGETQSAFLFARAGTIFGGTSEVQRNVVGERVLGLPREPRPGRA
jgi:alkylation response protein AidB-like acyl-CoA dehydrogenase